MHVSLEIKLSKLAWPGNEYARSRLLVWLPKKLLRRVSRRPLRISLSHGMMLPTRRLWYPFGVQGRRDQKSKWPATHFRAGECLGSTSVPPQDKLREETAGRITVDGVPSLANFSWLLVRWPMKGDMFWTHWGEWWHHRSTRQGEGAWNLFQLCASLGSFRCVTRLLWRALLHASTQQWPWRASCPLQGKRPHSCKGPLPWEFVKKIIQGYLRSM